MKKKSMHKMQNETKNTVSGVVNDITNDTSVCSEDKLNQKEQLKVGDASSYDVSNFNLTDVDIDSLIHMYQDEKLAMDVYDTLAQEYGSYIFDRISDSESKHLSVVENVLVSNGIDIEDLKNLNAGEFLDENLQALYDSIMEVGLASYEDALNVGVKIEKFDIDDLQELEANVELNTTLVGIYTNLESASYNHLDAFEQASY